MSDAFTTGSFCSLPTEGGAGTDAREKDTDVRIYGKEGCPHTGRARAALPGAAFFDVLDPVDGPARLAEMLALSGGVRRVPVIVRTDAAGRESVEVGFRRGA